MDKAFSTSGGPSSGPLCRCILNIDSLPAFYKLKAKFIGRNSHVTSRPSGPDDRCYLHAAGKNAHVAKFSAMPAGCPANRGGGRVTGHGHIPSTKESFVKMSATKQASYYSFVSSGEHPHSDGRLLELCRHKYCSSRRANNNQACAPPSDGTPWELGGDHCRLQCDVISGCDTQAALHRAAQLRA
ncbi:hypothetical protein C0Q70_10922 [Pomacea canaliculata]|uniref:Uncharacterized protein n=1 Tax=Pomacea canaliculata TaxID=400727 RepID=A0A2T7P4I0_POMCA|nr:hypothetical protein C0Q70_10922 [Pomacea canaliculata]